MLEIDSSIYKKHKKAYEYALAMTKKEIQQGSEAMYHNLNSLQLR